MHSHIKRLHFLSPYLLLGLCPYTPWRSPDPLINVPLNLNPEYGRGHRYAASLHNVVSSRS